MSSDSTGPRKLPRHGSSTSSPGFRMAPEPGTNLSVHDARELDRRPPYLTRARVRSMLDDGNATLSSGSDQNQLEQVLKFQNEIPTSTSTESDPCIDELRALEDNRLHLAQRRRRHTNSRARRRDHPVSTWMSMKRIARDFSPTLPISCEGNRGSMTFSEPRPLAPITQYGIPTRSDIPAQLDFGQDLPNNRQESEEEQNSKRLVQLIQAKSRSDSPSSCVFGKTQTTTENRALAISGGPPRLADHYRRPLTSSEDYSKLLDLDAMELCEAPFTDSGYATLPSHEMIAKSQKTHSAQEQFNVLASGSSEDGQSAIFSVATSIVPSVAQQLISEVCKDIYYKIGDEIAKNICVVTDGRLSVLIKAFAIKLGTSPSGEVNRRVMHFVYKHHGRICQELENMFHHAPRDEFDECSQFSESMSLNDKIHLWNTRSTDEPSKVNLSELFEGVDDENEDVNSPEISAYSRFMFSHSAYTWLIRNLLKQSTQYWGEAESRAMIDIVQRPILGALPAERISRRRDPSSYGGTFWLSWRPILERLKEEPASQGTTPIAEIVVLTASSVDQVQAITITEYLDQTWTLDGKDLLRALQKAVDTKPGDVISVVRQDKSNIKVTINESTLIVHVVGSAYFLTQCGEQLAWLGAALQPWRPGFVIHSTPYLTEATIPPSGTISAPLSILPSDDHVSALAMSETQLSRRGFWEGLPRHQNWVIGLENSTKHKPMTLRQQLENHLARPVIVRGFPTRRRPQLDLGLEVPATLLFSLANVFSQAVDGKCPSLQGLSYTLSMVKKANGMITWHITRSPGYSCVCKLCPSLGQDITTDVTGDPSKLHQYRHIIEECSSSEMTDGVAAIEACASSPGEFYADPWEAAPLVRSTDLEFSAPSADSMDSDMLSISDNSNDTPATSWTPSDQLASIINFASQQLILEFRRVEAIVSTNGPGFNISESTIPLDGSGSPRDTSGDSKPTNDNPNLDPGRGSAQSRKRNRDYGDGDESNSNGNDPNQPPSKKSGMEACEAGPKMLACPFWKSDPEKFKRCFQLKLSEIKRVKQHLIRKHTPEHYCNRCLVVFLSEESLEDHLKHETCARSESAKLEGISYEQRKKLHSKSKLTCSESERWFVIWTIIFPNEPRPSSPYIPTGASEDLARFLEFAQRRAASILFQRLRANGIISASDEEMSLTEQEILRQGFNDVYEQWLPTFPSLPGSATSTSTLRGYRPMHHETLGSLPDSAVALGSQTQPSESQFASSSTQGERLALQQSDSGTGSLENATAPYRMLSFAEPIVNNIFPEPGDGLSTPRGPNKQSVINQY